MTHKPSTTFTTNIGSCTLFITFNSDAVREEKTRSCEVSKFGLPSMTEYSIEILNNSSTRKCITARFTLGDKPLKTSYDNTYIGPGQKTVKVSGMFYSPTELEIKTDTCPEGVDKDIYNARGTNLFRVFIQEYNMPNERVTYEVPEVPCYRSLGGDARTFGSTIDVSVGSLSTVKCDPRTQIGDEKLLSIQLHCYQTDEEKTATHERAKQLKTLSDDFQDKDRVIDKEMEETIAEANRVHAEKKRKMREATKAAELEIIEKYLKQRHDSLLD